ncbi:hypothetical protein [Adhaeribacter soli]|uniref:DUF4625 domain-containing protein n=1 Tax=Adhaeribacter soli TaxID=2607655 RepID=A0A5N1J790_9BACT|nr:hypothetical protein [Adhaeribacter soli]KAA9345832.1 hypothetical protein F0P94_01750 [Adhaeribacter soli]
MKKNRLNQIVLSVVFGFSVILSACTEKDDPDPDPENHATFAIDSPREGDLLTSNNTLTISGMIRGEQELGGYSIIIRRKSDSLVIFERTQVAHHTALPFNEQYTTGKVIAPSDLELEVIANLGSNGQTSSKKINIRAIP